MSDVNPLQGYSPAELSQLMAASGLDEATAKLVSEFVASFLPPADDTEEGEGFRLPNLPPPTGGLSLDSLFDAIGAEMRRQICRDGVSDIEIRGQQQEEENAKQLEELKKQLDAMKEKSFWGGFLKVFKIIGMIAGAIASACAGVAGVLTGNPALIAVGVIGVLMVAESVVSMATDGKISLSAAFTELGKACGMSDETAQKFALGMQIALSVALIGVCVGAAISCTASRITEQTSAALERAMGILINGQLAGAIFQGAATVGQGAVSIYVAVLDKEATDAQAAQKRIEAVLQRIRDFVDMMQNLLEAEMERVNALTEDVSDIVRQTNETKKAILTQTPAMV